MKKVSVLIAVGVGVACSLIAGVQCLSVSFTNSQWKVTKACFFGGEVKCVRVTDQCGNNVPFTTNITEIATSTNRVKRISK